MGFPLGVACFLSLLSAFLLWLSFPHPHLSGLIWVAVVPFLLACRGQGWRRGAALGFLMGCGFQYSLLSWASVFGVPAQIGLVFYKAVGPAVLGMLLGLYRPRTPLLAVVFAASAWVGMEYYQILGPLGMTWGMLSHSQTRVLPMIQIGELVGPWGLSWVIALANATLAELALSWKAGRTLASLRPALALTAGSILATLIFGLVRLQTPWEQGPSVTWGVVQTSMPQNQRWDPSFREEIMQRLERLTRSAAARGARVVVWPETSVPYPAFLQTWPLRERVGELATSTNTWIMAGSIEFGSESGSTRNVASLVAPNGEVLDSCDKMRLVPFGEYLPLPRFMRDWSVFDRVMRYVPGSHLVLFKALFPIPNSPPAPVEQPVLFGTLICYESMVPQEPLRRVDLGAQVLVVMTNDAWFGKSSAAMHHFEMAIMRAVEMRRPVVHCGNNGICGFIGASGQVMSQSRLDEILELTAPVRGETCRTLYSRIGDALAYLCLLSVVVLWRWQAKSSD